MHDNEFIQITSVVFTGTPQPTLHRKIRVSEKKKKILVGRNFQLISHRETT